jgi:hypothetical protein
VDTASATSPDTGGSQAEPSPSATTGPPEPAVQPTQTTHPDQTGDQPPLTSARKLAELFLKPGNVKVGPGKWQDYKAIARGRLGRYPWSLNVTGLTDFTIDPDGSCEKSKKGKVRCRATKIGPNTVTGILPPRAIRLVPFELEGTATLEVTDPREPDHLRLEPDPKGPIQLGGRVTYKAVAVAKDNTELDEVTAQTDFSIDQGGSCQGATCTPVKAGPHTVTGSLRDHQPPVQDTATLEVTDPPRVASISSVTPDFLPAGRLVEVRGNTGSCNRAGRLTLHGRPNKAFANVTGDEHGEFVASLTVPTGTYPMSFKLELTVDCNGQLQRAERELTVINLAPVAADDFVVTTQDTSVAIAVTGNDRNPDPDTGYQTVVVQHGSPPRNGTIQVHPDGIIIYTPRSGFIGQDQFQYGLCDNIINAAGTADCGTATVSVTVNPRTPTTPGPPGGGSPGGGSPGGGGPSPARPCAPSPSDLQQRLQVTPVKGPGGTKLQITAKVDQKLAACSLRLLLGGASLGPDISVGPDGSISAQPPVPLMPFPGAAP